MTKFTVSELIEHLQQFPEDAPVRLQDGRKRYTNCYQIYFDSRDGGVYIEKEPKAFRKEGEEVKIVWDKISAI